jgi:hypothetical protein
MPLDSTQAKCVPVQHCHYTEFIYMSVKAIQVGQVWRKVGSGETFLVTRLYTQALATIAVLRPTGNEMAAMLRVKVERTPEGQTIPGFSMAQDTDD